MDSYRGHFDRDADGFAASGHDAGDDDFTHEPLPLQIGQDERRMQVRAYNYWAGLLDDRSLPSIEDLDPTALPDFGPYSVLLDFTGGIDNPAVRFVGERLAEECDADRPIEFLSEVPSRSLLSRITDHYMQILANHAPIGFEAEFVNQRARTTLYRGILLPFSSNDDDIDFIYGVINWKELADQRTTDELLLEIDQALSLDAPRSPEPLAAWADGPAETTSLPEAPVDWPTPAFGFDGGDAGIAFATTETLDDDASDLAACLAAARALAQAAEGSEDRTRQTLYGAIGRAYDVSLAASSAPEEFAAILADTGIAVQDRAPMTPVVKLVFGADYDKTRITEYATALGHACRVGVERGALADYLAQAEGGLKGVVKAERAWRRAENGKLAAESNQTVLLRKLRALPHSPLGSVASDGEEFALLVARRLASGEVVLLGEVADDPALLERAARKLAG